MRNLIAPARAGIDFFEDSRKALRANEKALRGKSLYPRSDEIVIPERAEGANPESRARWQDFDLRPLDSGSRLRASGMTNTGDRKVCTY
jgi:hypothetical protein